MTGIVIPDGGTIGSTSDTDAISISSGGVVTASASIQTDTISEKTSANGVSIDGLKVKDYSLMYGSNIGVTINSNGYVLKPNQPMCCVRRTAGNVSATNVILFDHTPTNIGSHYNSSNGRFTCPVSGQYEVHIGAHAQNVSTIVIQTRKNGSVHQEEYQSGALFGHVSVASIITCSAGDYIDAFVNTGTVWGGVNGPSGARMTVKLLS
jgi:hypothetical protein